MFFYQEFTRLKRNLPTVAHITLNLKCMHRCKTCGYWKIYRGKRDRGMRKEEIFRICDDLISFGIRRFRFVDTEPLLRKDLPEIIGYLKEKKVNVQVVTTGMNLDENLAKNIVLAQLDLIRFSIDGYNELNDFIRGVKGAYEKAIRGIRILKKVRGNSQIPKIHVFTVVSRLNIHEIERIRKKIIEDTGGIDGYQAGPVLELKKEAFERTIWKGEKVGAENLIPWGKSYSLTYTQAKKLVKIQEGRGISTGRIVKLADGIFCTRRKKCPSFHQVHIDVDGNLVPCSFLPGIKLGNLKEKSIKELWRKGEHLEFINYLRKSGFPVCFEICWRRSIFNIASKTASLREFIFKRTGKF